MSSQILTANTVSPELEDRVLIAGLKVAVFVEHAVVGQESLVVDAGQASVVGDRGGVEDVVAGVDEADYGSDVIAVGTRCRPASSGCPGRSWV